MAVGDGKDRVAPQDHWRIKIQMRWLKSYVSQSDNLDSGCGQNKPTSSIYGVLDRSSFFSRWLWDDIVLHCQ
jgi:hypothetical protein